jgi:cyclopropane-fatty-acyl-phospholipid synthase
MLDAHGRQLLAVIGKSDGARGVITPAEMSDAIDRLQAAGLQDQHAQDQASAEREDDDADAAGEPDRVGIAQRSFPLLQMLKRALAAGEPILWGV